MAAGVAMLWTLLGVCVQIQGSYLPGTVTMETRCGELYSVDEEFVLRLTSYGKKYPPNFRCELQLEARRNHILVMKFRSVNIYVNSVSCRDYVEIFDGYDASARSLTDPVCHNSSITKGSVTSSSEQVAVWFRSDGYGEDKGFEILITPTYTEALTKAGDGNAIFIGIAVATSAVLLVVAIGMCICVYSNRKKQQARRRRRQERRNTRQLQMTLELTGISNPTGPPPTPDVTAPAYTPPTAPPPYSTLPRRLSSVEEATKAMYESSETRQVTPAGTEHPPPPYDENL